ncbi:CcdC family protein [Paenibacillus sp. CMAA1364]
MFDINNPTVQLVITLGTAIMALFAIFIRTKTSNTPVTIKKIVIPPIGMSTGFFMFVVPMTHIPIWWALVSFLLGWFVFSYPLIRGTRFKVVDDQVYTDRSKSFIFILLGMLAVRLLLHQIIERYISIPQTGSLFFILAFGMIVHWRVFMLKEYKRVIQ